ncbi:TrmH family RNA methyltransferase [Riemerella columbina]|uniref:TrmH family RNA methyltransferase n=1 Tax=Riemerella columbina TaxID=103810 RepID=UPI002670B3E8|nr:RNA methyltransferase [Riemerella columbina]WKS94502.1 RNA methyltransferase [Riemerella columbina]
MLTTHRIKILKSLDKKKFRQKYNLFLVEGNKIIKELKTSKFKIDAIYSTTPEELDFLPAHLIAPITPQELKKISFLQTPKDSVAVCQLLPESQLMDTAFNLVLDGIQDPGNLGTIIRLADWFGVEQIICSPDTVDFYNPKVIQASMGSFTRVQMIYTELSAYLSQTSHTNIGTDMAGDNLYQTTFPEKVNLILGNEGNGIRPETEKLLQRSISIPRFSQHQATESLNVSMAAGIILGQIFGQKLQN